MTELRDPAEAIARIAADELANTRRLIAAHLKTCTEPRQEPGSLAGTCDTCRSLAAHLARCERQVELLATEAPEMEALF